MTTCRSSHIAGSPCMCYCIYSLLHILLLVLLRTPSVTSFSIESSSLPSGSVSDVVSPNELVTSWLLPNPTKLEQSTESTKIDTSLKQSIGTAVLSKSVLLVPPNYMKENVVFLQRATNTRIEGRAKLESMGHYWESTFETDQGDVTFELQRVSTIGPTTVLVQWNITWVPPTALWLEFLAKRWPAVTPIYQSYTHLSDKESITFSYTAVFKLFQQALETGKLRIPLACIQGTSTLEFDTITTTPAKAITTTTTTTSSNRKDDENDTSASKRHRPRLKSIVEDLNYAQDLQRGALRNRKCANDLRLFLETGRCVRPEDLSQNQKKKKEKDDAGQNNYNSNNDSWDWDRVVSNALPWESVPGMNPLEIDSQEDGAIAVPIFLGIVVVTLLSFSAIVAPELIGQSMFGGPTYIVPPDELNSIF